MRADGSRCGQLLLVEDDKEVAELTREMLSAIGFAVIHASSPDAALGALANGRPIDFVLSDIMMPGGVSGVELAREIRVRHPNVRIVLTTGYAEAAAQLDGQQFGLVLKPYTLESLAEALGVEVG
jgi:CheY-like chemotaxis protein